MEFLDPWEEYENNSLTTIDELKRELCKEHILYGVKVSAIAHRCDCDDVLFRLHDFSHEYAVVHLTYSKETKLEFPSTELFKNKDSWVNDCMIPDNEEYTC